MANSDDRILLNLVLNEATVNAVEGRVRNLVNRLNNTNISLNINGRNLDNIVNRLNDIQQRMQTINSTPINITANLTSAQQQYRLETERMRVSQQLELSRQRTLQTENQAISALAQQNRTLNINNNVTHQIERGAQNIGNNMNVAGGHARDFVDYLADGVRYIVVYRSLYEIMNQIGEAFSEMKNVDKELISVRKTTGMAENEIENIRQSSYGVATEYGRTASEYLGSVAEFARGGYKELSTELAKVSLLTQNVGDVSADSANKMLLSVDAAYKLNGNVTELTNVVNGLNNIANLNPTSMQKLADGMQVSASVAKVAGLEISDLVALVGTGTAVTQREGSEISRAIRTILMNIRAVKGELDDGTVIDGESIAKAQSALEGVGIATKEVVNGVRELRDPMDILDELAGKWSSLNSEAQSIVLENLANKRQANVLAAILENWDMVGKMQNEYFNSANSAIEENELYLKGWEATQKRVSAKWTEFIANMADTALITGSLNALYGVLVGLDTPIGRIATSIVLINTALAVSGRMWQAIRARSIVADILSMGVAERNLGTAVQLVAGHLWEQARAWAATPFGMATLAVSGIMLINSAIEEYKEKVHEAAQEASEQSKKSSEYVNNLLDLKTQLEEGTKSSDELTSAFKEQLKAMGYTETEIDNLIAKYGGLSGAMDEATKKALEQAKTDAYADVAAASKALEVDSGGGLITDILIGDYKTGVDQLDSEIEKIMSDVAIKTSTGNEMAWTAKDQSAEGLYEYYNTLKEVSKLIQETASETNNSGLLDLGNVLNPTVYGEVTEAINKLKDSAELYVDAISRLHNVDAQLELSDYLKTHDINSQGSFDNYINGVKNSTDYSESYKQVLIDVANNAFPQFSKQAQDAGDNIFEFADKTTASLDNLKTASDSIGTLQKAFKELSDDGYITIDTLSSIKKTVGESIDNWDEYEKVLMNAKVGSEEFNDAMTDLTYKTLDQTFAGSDLSDVTEQQIAAVLRENDVVNADAVAHEYLTYLKAQERAESVAMALATDASSVNLAIEAAQCGMTAEQFSNLIIQQILFNQTNLDIGQKLEALQQLGLYANWTAEQLAKVQNTTITYSDGKWWVNSYGEDADNNGELDYMGSQEYKGYQPMTKPSDFKITPPKFSGGGSGKSGGGSSKEKDPEKEREDQEKKELEQLKASLDARKEVIEKYKESIDITDFGLDISEEKDFALRTDLLNSKLNQVTAYGQAMRKEFERVSKIVPKTADQAEALSSQLSTLGSNMRNNVKTLRETQIALQQLKINAVTTSAKDNMDDMQTELSRLEKRIGLLNDDNKNEYKYTNKILNMETLLPTNAEMTGRRKNRSRADQDVIRAEEETQNVLNDMYQEQIKKNENLREDERQALLDAMAVMRNDMVINMQNASSEYVNYGNEVITTTNTYTKTVTDTVNSMNLVLPKPDTSKFAEVCNEVEKMISNLGKGVSYEITPKSDGRGGGDAASLLRGNKKTIIKNVADGQLGVPYLWGGVTPGAGLDCSGLTQYVYRSVGVNIPRIADDQLKSGVGTRVDTRNLQVGDQLFFGDGKEASHTGIYVGNGMMIHAPSTGDVVKYSNINSEYYQSRLMGAKRYALGTSSSSSEIALVGDDKEGKLNKIRPELIVGKNGVRLAGQNGAEFVNLESGDQVIPYEKTRQILQRSDIGTPRYASGTVSPGAIAAYIKQKYPQVTDAAIAGLLANIQQESSFVVDAKTIEAYGGGDNTPTARWGLFQLDDKRVPGWSNIVQNGTWQQQIDRAFQNGGYNSNENSGMGKDKYNVWKHVLTNSNLSAGQAARDWDHLFERSDGKSSDKRAANAEGYYKKLLSGTLENTDALTANTNALQEELDPIKQAVAEINKYPKSFEDGIQKLINPAKVRERELAFTEDMTKANKQIELFNIYKPIAQQAAQDGTAKYEELLKQYLQYLDDVDDGIAEYSQEIVDAYNDGLSGIKDSVMDVEDTLINVKNDLIDAVEKRIDKIDTYINDRNFYKDWDKYGDNEYKATLRKIQQYDQLLQEGIITQKEYLESIESLKQDAISLLKEDLSSSLDKYMSDVNEYKDKKIEEINFDSSKASSRQTLLQAHYDLINSIAEEQHTINNELKKSKTMYEYLNEDTRKLLFNQEDYNKLTAELNSISAKANKLQDEYLYKISHAQKEDLDEITSQYQMQYDMLMKQYEVEKARLEVTKKQQQLNNVLKERNVRMFIDGQWKWVANTEQVQNAKTELADAEFQVQQAKNSKLQQTKLNSYQTIQDRNTTRINYIESDRDRRQEEVDSINEILDGDSIRSMAEILQDFADSDFPEVRDLLYKIANKIGYENTPYSNKVDYMAEILNAGTEEQAVQLYKMRSKKMAKENLPYEEYTEDEIRKKYRERQNNTDYMDKILNALSIEEVYKNNTSRNEKIDRDGLTFDKMSNDQAIQKWKDNLMANNYLQQMYDAKTLEEAIAANKMRNAKIEALDLDATIYDDADIKDIWNEYRKKTDYTLKIKNSATVQEALDWNRMRTSKILDFGLDAPIFTDDEIRALFEQGRLNEINQIANEVSPAMESLQDNDDFWQKSKEILKENSEGVNDALISLLEESIPNFKELLGKSATCIVEWVKQVTQENIDDETDYLDFINNATSFSEAMRYNDLRDAKIDRLGLADGKLTEEQIKEIVGNNQQAFANRVASETTYITTQLEEASDFWERANELLKDNSEGVNDVLVELLKNTIPNFEDLLDASANAILKWVKTITQKKIVANTIVSVTDDKSSSTDDTSVNHYATGTDYTQAGDAVMGETDWELFFSKHGEFTPITRPTFANIPSGGVVFNQEQMSNVRKLWDLSNQNITNYTKYMTKQQPQTIDKRDQRDQSIKINGMNVDTTNGKELVEAIRRYVSIH